MLKFKILMAFKKKRAGREKDRSDIEALQRLMKK